MKKLTEDEFYEQFNMVTNHIDDNASFDGCMFETFGEELKYVKEFAKKNPDKVWTILDSDGKMFYSTGVHLVNRLGYFITEEDAVGDIEVEIEGVEEDENFDEE